ncbi:lipase 1-like [Thrips palmi]|uniref:Lipase n=1 Tax=Thrips palmi TaxID=161013 RepID=A0A6P8ZLV7_THRPL|nr:lipase 1-like [Thrips palmi]
MAQTLQGHGPGVTWLSTARYVSDESADRDILSARLRREKEEGALTQVRLAEKFGYVGEAYTVRTPDGYILTIHRISKAAHQNNDQLHRTPVLFGHALGGNSEEYVAYNHSTSYALVDAGFDVWLGNYRGSFYGRKHVKLNPKMPEFWDFSWHENAVIDEPTIIDYVLHFTGRPKLFLIGHSMGATAQAVLLASRPEYAKKKVLGAVLMSPQTYVENPGRYNIFQLVVGTLYSSIPVLKESIKSYVVNGPMPLYGNCVVTFCFPNNRTEYANYCRFMIDAVFGKSHKPMTDAQAQTLFAHFPQGASIRQFMHYAQAMASHGEFRHYDYGPVKNRQLYGSAQPPSYNFSAIVTPTYVICGKTDYSPGIQDCLKFVNATPAVKRHLEVPYNHADFLVSDDVDEYLNKPIIDIFMKYI